jgi:hypothetical protein
MMPAIVEATNAPQVLAELRAVDRKVRNRTVRRATVAAGKEVLTEVKRQADSIRVTGFTRRSLKSLSKSKSGSTTVRVGQEKQKQFKARKTTRAKGKNLSQIQRAGKPVPIHWIERGTSPHTFSAAGKGNKRTYSDGSNVLVFRVGRRLVYARTVRHPGNRGLRILERSGRAASSKAAAAFISTAKEDLRNVGK